MLILVFGAIAVGLRYLPVVDDVRDVRISAARLSDQAQALQPADIDQSSLDELRASLSELDTDLQPLRDLMTQDPLVEIARSLPGTDTQVRSADALVRAADALMEAGHTGLGLADEVVRLREANEVDPDFALLPGLVELMATSGDDIDRIGELVAAVDFELARIPDAAVAQLREARDLVAGPLDTYAPLLQAYREYDDILPGLLGWGDEKRYLVLAQNSAELRPTGGYTGTVGIVSILDGAITEQTFTDIYELDTQPGLPFIEPPPELADYLLGDEQSWRLADANWSPHFPASAAKAIEFYELETGDSDIDGVIALTTNALDRLLEVVGPVAVPAYDITVAPGDVTLALLGATRGTPQSLEGRKDVLDALSRTLMSRLLSLPPDRWIAAGQALQDIGTEHMAVVWLEDEAAQALVEDAGWDGSVRQEPGDYLYVVESNMAPTSKYNLVVDRTDSLVVKLDDEGNAVNSLRLDWQNRAGEDGELYDSLRAFSNNKDGWYGAYVRVLTPLDSELITASGQASDSIRGVERVAEESGRSTFANYLFMPPDASTLTYLWTVPSAAVEVGDGWLYELVIQKQPGARAMPQSIRLDLPAGAVVTEVSDGAVVEGDRVLLEADLVQDVVLRVAYELTVSTP